MGYDRRVAYTKRVIEEALFELIEDSDVNEITIKEICAKADINRATFYRHYQDIYDLYLQVAAHISAPSLERNCDNKSFIEALPDQLAAAKEHIPFYQSMMKNNIGLQIAQENIEDNRRRYVESRVALGEDPFLAQATFDFVSHGVTGIINDWVMADCVTPIEKVVDAIKTLITKIYA